LITHEVLKDKFLKAMGNKIPMDARERWASFIREKQTEFMFRYEWIKDRRFYDWVYHNTDQLDIKDGEEWFGVYIYVT
tara:strand:+ start:2432 stop:2665 length:234 start_codon:yes stop_codon:yes gene_type:complete